MVNESKTNSENVGELRAFIKHASQQGMRDEMVRHLLLSNGWKDKAICQGIATESLQMAIPESRQKGGAREAFFHLSAFTCLYVSVVSFIILIFHLFDVSFPDGQQNVWSNEWAYSAIRSSLSAVVVFFPLYLLFQTLIDRDIKRGGTISGGAVERWLTYLTLFVIVMTVLVDAATLLYWFLEGEMTVRLLLKVLALFVVMAAAFLFIWWELKRWSMDSKISPGVGKG